MNELVHSRHSVGLSNYHMQFTPKYRRDVFRDRVVMKKCRESCDILPAMNGGASHEGEGWQNPFNVV